jgi:glycosyltransferase involved in cell wall biosynthesis
MADAFLLPSKYEGVPMVILEALACGTPVIATKVGGIPDLIKPGVNGLLLESGDARAIAEAVSTLMSSVPAREEVCDTVAQLSSKRVAHDLVRLFESVAAMDRAKKKEPGDPEHGHGRSSGGEEESLTPEP